MKFWLQDLRYGVRQMGRSPAFTAIAALALALGIGANAVIFSVVDAVVLRPLDFPQPEELVMIWSHNHEQGLEHQQLSPVNWTDFRGMKHVFEDLTGWWHPDINLTDRHGEPVRVRTIAVTDNFFDVVRVPLTRGRGFRAGEDQTGAPRVVVIGYGFWQSRYGGDEGIIGQTVELDARAYEVVGVAAPGFSFPGDTQVWQPLGWDASDHSRGAHFFETVGRLMPGVTIEDAQAEIDALTGRWQTEFPRTNRGWGSEVVSLHDETVGGVRPALLLMLAAVGLVLVIACANVANLLLARSTARQREVAVRAALGAHRWRIVRQFLTESVLLALLGGGLGLLLAFGGLRLLVTATPFDIPRLEMVSIDLRVLAFAFAVALGTGVLFGLAPALQMVRSNLQETLQDGGRSLNAGSAGQRLRGLLVVAEVALAMMLLVGSGLLIRSFVALLDEDPGFQPDRKASVNVNLPRTTYSDWNRVSQFFTQLLDRLNQQEGMQADASGFLPLDSGWRISYVRPDDLPADAGDAPRAQYRTISDSYLRTMGIPLLRGRIFESRDDAQRPGVVVINQKLAEASWPDGDPVGEKIRLGALGVGPLARSLIRDPIFEVIGVVANVKNNSIRSDSEPAIYLSQRQFPYRSMNVVVSGRGTALEKAEAVRREVRQLDPSLPLSEIRRLDDLVSGSMAQPRFFMLLLTGFAALAMLLAALGIYGVLSFAVSQRRHEIGVRMAFGARRQDVMRLVVGQGFALILAGLAAGALGSLLLARAMSSLLFGVESLDPATFALVPAVLALVGLTACYLPARRASSVDPLIALRYE